MFSWFLPFDVIVDLDGDGIALEWHTQHEIFNQTIFFFVSVALQNSLRILTSECVADHERTPQVPDLH